MISHSYEINVKQICPRTEKLCEDLHAVLQKFIDNTPEDIGKKRLQSDMAGALLSEAVSIFDGENAFSVLAFLIGGIQVLIQAKKNGGMLL